MAAIKDHPLRYALNSELHARPFPSLSAPHVAAYLAVRPPGDAATRDRSIDLEHLTALLKHYGAPLPASGRSFDNSYDSSGVIAPTVNATTVVQLAAGDTISVYGVAYASANYLSSSNNSASLQIAALN